MPELIDELKSVQAAILRLEGDLRQVKEAQGRGVDLTPIQAELADLKKTRDELREEIKKLGTPAAPPKKTKEEDDGSESGFWD